MNVSLLWKTFKQSCNSASLFFTVAPKLLFYAFMYYVWLLIYSIQAKEGDYIEDFPRLMKYHQKIVNIIIEAQIKLVQV